MADMHSSQAELGLMRQRITKEGRKLTYQLTVIQQPERARACGSGAKSSADRRPVDPPPVVRLRIFEGPDAANDITFSYDANFFLFATLELARPINHGRVQPSAQQIPVLTGMPVSGMAYLDRPDEAGYFIFPDLSVRHEGKYKLSFNLYEQTKRPQDKDDDESSESKKQSPLQEAYPDGSFDWRMEVKSNQFTVYSAKKFPGLSESTALSRTVAEQGCRVRIRRDVRMRRRDGKANGEYDEFDEEYSRARRTATPDSVHDAYSRPRSLSSTDRQQYAPDVPRRPPGVDYPQQSYPSNFGVPPPVTPQSTTAAYPNLSFGPSSSQQYQAPHFTQPHAPPPPPQQHQYQAPAQSVYNQTPQYRPSSGGYGGYSDRQPYNGQYSTTRANYEPDYRRSSVSACPPATPTPVSSQYPPAEQTYNRPSQGTSFQPQYPPRTHSPTLQPPVLAPLKLLEPKYETLSSPVGGPLSATNRVAPALPSPSYQDRSGASNSFLATAEPPRSNKRSYESVFSSSTYNQPLHNGQRPSSSHHTQASSSAFDDDNESVSMEALRMQYKRADGSNHFRELPTLE